MTDFLKKVWRTIIPEAKKVKVVHKILGEVVEADINKELAKDRGFVRGELAVAKAELKEKENEIRKIKVKERKEGVDAAEQEFKELVRQNTTLSKKYYIGSFELSRLYKPVKKGSSTLLRDKVRVLSYDHQTKFGTFYELLALKSGRFALVVKDKAGRRKPVIIGSTLSDIFTNSQALNKEIALGILTVNVTSEGQPHTDPFAEEVPRTLITATGGIVRSSYDTERAMNLIDELTAEKLEMAERLRRYESALNQQSLKVKTTIQAQKLASESAEESSKVLIAAMNASKAKDKVFYELHKQADQSEFAKEIEENRNARLEEVKTEVMNQLGDKLGKSNMAVAEAELKNYVDWIIGAGFNAASEKIPELTSKIEEQDKKIAMLERRSTIPKA